MNKAGILFCASILLFAASCSTDNNISVLEEGYINGADKVRIYYKVMGSGQDSIVVIHGGPGAGMNSFLPSVKPLANDFVLIFYDQRGGGKSTLPEDTTHLKPEYYVEDLEAVRKHFGLKKMNVITHSFGSILLAEYALEYPQHLKRVVFHGSTGPKRSEMGKYYQEKARQASPSDTALSNRASKLLSGLLTGTAENPKAVCEEYEQLSKEIAIKRGERVTYKGSTCDAPAEAVHYYYRFTAQLAPNYFGSWNYTGRLDSLLAPLLVVYGEKDSLGIPPQQRWTHITQNSKLLLVPDATKAAFSDNPEFVSPAIKTFFRGSWPEQAK